MLWELDLFCCCSIVLIGSSIFSVVVFVTVTFVVVVVTAFFSFAFIDVTATFSVAIVVVDAVSWSILTSTMFSVLFCFSNSVLFFVDLASAIVDTLFILLLSLAFF